MAKRICMVAYTHYRTDARPRRTAEALVARGDNVHFLALTQEGTPKTDTINGVTLESIDVKRYQGSGKLHYLCSYVSFVYKAFYRINLMHLQERFDVVYLHTMPDFIVFAGTLAKMVGVKVLLDVHDTMPELYQSKFGLNKGHLLIRALKFQERLSCHFADHVICVHEPHRKLLENRKSVHGNTSVLMNLPDPTIFGAPATGELRVNEAAPRLVYHGTIAHRLGLDLALHAFVQVKHHFPQARFDIYGTGDAAKDVQALIRELDLSESVSFSDSFFPVEDIPRLLEGASIGIIPNRQDPATELMLPVKLLEYLHCGIAVVAPKLRAIEHYFPRDSISYYSPNDVESCADAICALLREPHRRTRQSELRDTFFRNYAWDVMKQDLYAAVDAV